MTSDSDTVKADWRQRKLAIKITTMCVLVLWRLLCFTDGTLKRITQSKQVADPGS